MVAHTIIHPSYTKRPALLMRWYLSLRYPQLDWLPRRDVFISVLLILAGLSLPAAMILGWLLLSFSLVFLSLALLAVGGTLLLIRCGEI